MPKFTPQQKVKAIQTLYQTGKIWKDRKDLLIKLNK